MQYLFLLLLIGFGLEIFSIFLMASWIGGLATFGLMVLSMLAGSALLRNNMGISKVMMAGQILRGGGISFYDMLFPVRIPLASILLISPGFFSTVFAILLLLPFKSKQKEQNQTFQFGQFGEFQYTQHRYSGNDDDVIEGEYTVQGQKPNKHRIDDVIEHQPKQH